MKLDKRNMWIAVALAVVVILAAFAGTFKNQAKSGTEAETSSETSAKERTQQASQTEDIDPDSEETEEESLEEDTESQDDTAEKTGSEAGSIASGVFQSASGKYQIVPPQGWIIEGDSDENVVTFLSPDGRDVLEVVYAEGADADSEREIYPDTMEEYAQLIGRGEEMEFTRYQVENSGDGSQTFRYAIRYTGQDGVRYYAVAGSYRTASRKYLRAEGTIETEGGEAESRIDAALD